MGNKEIQNSLLESMMNDIEVTAANYAQMYGRLHLRDSASKFFVTYYSVFAILFSLIPILFVELSIKEEMVAFLSISVSIVVLVASLLISFAKYSERALKAVKALDDLKRLKKELSKYKYTDENLLENKFEIYDRYVNRYHQIVDCMELRTDVDYYRSCKKLSTKKGHEDRWYRLPTLSKFIAHSSRFFDYLIYVILGIFPFIAICWCF